MNINLINNNFFLLNLLLIFFLFNLSLFISVPPSCLCLTSVCRMFSIQQPGVNIVSTTIFPPTPAPVDCWPPYDMRIRHPLLCRIPAYVYMFCGSPPSPLLSSCCMRMVTHHPAIVPLGVPQLPRNVFTLTVHGLEAQLSYILHL